MREVLKALGDTSATGETRLMRAPPAPRAAAPAADPSLSDTQVLKMLETRRPEGAEAAPRRSPRSRTAVSRCSSPTTPVRAGRSRRR